MPTNFGELKHFKATPNFPKIAAKKQKISRGGLSKSIPLQP